MARSGKYLYYKNDTTTSCIALYDSDYIFNCVAGYVKPLNIKVGDTNYYAPISTSSTASDKLKIGECFIRNCVGSVIANGYAYNTNNGARKELEGYGPTHSISWFNFGWKWQQNSFSCIMSCYFVCTGNWDYYWNCCVGTNMYPPRITMNGRCMDSNGCTDYIKVTYTLNSDGWSYSCSRSYNGSSSTYYCITPPTIIY